MYPPLTRPCEPPAGIARISGTLRSQGIRCAVLDSNLEVLLELLNGPHHPADTWTRRAVRNLPSHMKTLKGRPAYAHFSRYQRAVLDLNRVIQSAVNSPPVKAGLANYQDRLLSPLRSADLIRSAERPEESPFFSYFQNRLSRVVEETSPASVGISLNFLSQALPAFAMIGFLRKNFPGLKMILGGGLVTSWLKRPGWQNPFSGFVDSLIPGPGEAPLLNLLGRQPSAEFYSLPDYEGFTLEDYFAPGFILPYSGSAGCYWHRCRFCPERAEGNPYRPIPPERISRDLDLLVRRNRPALLHLLDNAVSPALLKELIRRPPGVPWYGFVRITEDLSEPDFCRALKKSGCALLQIGLESGDPRVLEQLQKGIDLEIASRALGNLKEAGISTYVYLLFGTPAETEKEARKTLDFIARRSDQIGFLNLAIFNLPVHGPDTEGLATHPFYEGDLSLYSDFSHPRGWDRDRVRAFLEKEFKRHPAIAPIVRRDPPIFTSNHAPFFTTSFPF